MDFFDKIGGKIVGAGQEVASQTKNLTETTKMSMNITNNEKEVLELYNQIGRIFYDENKLSEDCLCIDLVKRINDLLQENGKLKENINLLKGVVVCQNCAKEVSNKYNCCNYCGAPIIKPIQEAPIAKICQKCGMQLEADSKFCFNCGQMV